MTDCPPLLEWVRWRARELPDERADALLRHAQACPRCQARMRQIDEHASAYEQHAPQSLEALRHALDSERSRRPRGAAQLAGLAVAAAALLGVLPWVWDMASEGDHARRMQTSPGDNGVALGGRGAQGAGDAPTPGRRYKGGFGARMMVVRDGHAFEHGGATRLQPGDALKFSVQVGQPGHLALFGIDGHGHVTHYYPHATPQAADPLRLDYAGEHELPGAVVLDELAVGESWVFAFSSTHFDRFALAQQLKRAPWVRDETVPAPDKVGSVALQVRHGRPQR